MSWRQNFMMLSSCFALEDYHWIPVPWRMMSWIPRCCCCWSWLRNLRSSQMVSHCQKFSLWGFVHQRSPAGGVVFDLYSLSAAESGFLITEKENRGEYGQQTTVTQNVFTPTRLSFVNICILSTGEHNCLAIFHRTLPMVSLLWACKMKWNNIVIRLSMNLNNY